MSDFGTYPPQKRSHPQWVNPKLFLRNINCCVSTSRLTIFPTHLFKLLVLLPVSPFERAERQPQQKDSAVKPCKALNQPHAMLFPREIMINHNYRTCVSSLLPTQMRRVGIPLMLMGNLLASKSSHKAHPSLVSCMGPLRKTWKLARKDMDHQVFFSAEAFPLEHVCNR